MAVSDTDRSDAAPARDFRTTHWSVVLLARTPGSDSTAALEKLCRLYWYPVYGFIRQKGHIAENAQDLTQEFFAQLLEKNYLKTADASKGRFRTFLLTALSWFLANQWDRAKTLKRGGNCAIVSLNETDAEGRYIHEPACEVTPEKAYDRRWANELLANVLDRLSKEFARAGRAKHFEELKVFLVDDRGAVSCAAAADRLQMSQAGVKSCIYRLRQRYGELIRDEIAETVDRPEQVEEELRHLLDAMAD
jgi:RNA polymerase sigma factor (sigma-70 family)